MKNITRLAFAVSLAALSTGAAFAQELRPIGRADVRGPGDLSIAWPASGFETRLIGSKLTAQISDQGDSWVDVAVDGKTTALHLEPGSHDYVLFSGEAGQHTVRLTRRSTALGAMTHIVALHANGRLAATAAPERRILVIGDSIATGYGVEGLDRSCSYSRETQNANAAFPALIAQDFGADLNVVALDGRGLVRSWHGAELTMGDASWRTLPDRTALWNPKSFQPQVIVVNLGVYDFAGDERPSNFAASYATYLERLRGSYPNAQIYAAFGAMLDGEKYASALGAITTAVATRRTAGDRQVEVVELTPSPSERRYGCEWHPGLDAQKEMAASLEHAIAQNLSWVAAGSNVKTASLQ